MIRTPLARRGATALTVSACTVSACTVSAFTVSALTVTAWSTAAISSASAAPRQQATSGACQVPRQGHYAVMAMGTLVAGSGSTPEARLIEERWLAGGALEGRIVERLGSELRSGTYRGSVQLVGPCLAQVRRQLPWGSQLSEAVLDSRGRPLYSLDRGSGTVITARWLPMASGSCQAADLNGVVLSSQVGLNRRSGAQGWSPNAVIQREQWRDGRVQGLALSSHGGVGDTAAYSGRLQLEPNSCWGDLVERDARGVDYTYRALIVPGRNGARGYLYLQRDANDLSVGWLVRD